MSETYNFDFRDAYHLTVDFSEVESIDGKKTVAINDRYITHIELLDNGVLIVHVPAGQIFPQSWFVRRNDEQELFTKIRYIGPDVVNEGTGRKGEMIVVDLLSSNTTTVPLADFVERVREYRREKGLKVDED